jgi:hypothetical protein
MFIAVGLVVWSPAQIARSSDHVSNETLAGWSPERIVTWLSINFALPAIYDHPRINLLTPTEMNAVRYRDSDRPPGAMGKEDYSAQSDQEHDLEGLYVDAGRTIYLRQGWTGHTPAELSVLVHEMVHHLQNVAGMKYECSQAREKLAYEAQVRWLAQFGLSLVHEFEIDAMTVLIRTNCIY